MSQDLTEQMNKVMGVKTAPNPAENIFKDWRTVSITEIKESNCAEQGPLVNSPYNQIDRKMGQVKHRPIDPNMGMFKQLSSGKWFDWWKNEDGTVTIIEAE
jgi:hypothetical protein